jgi:geranylgeranyl diphosphate synthase type II
MQMSLAVDLNSLYEQTFNSNNFNSSPTGLYEPVNHIMGIKGKRIRPLLVLMGCQLFGGEVERALKPAFAMEVFHNFTLVHDDIMDQADLRRGVPTVHKKYGVNAGILAGDVMLAYAYKYLCSVPPNYIPLLMDAFSKTAIEIFEGQQIDMDFEKRLDVTEKEYLKMIEYKTSVLLACSVQIGAILADASVESQALIYEFGLNLGISFQIKDDYLDTFGEGAKVGKRIGGDILQNKKTYLFISALNSADAQQRQELIRLLDEADLEKKIAEVKQIFEATGARQQALKKAEELYNVAINSLQKISLPDNKKQPLMELAQMLNTREY